MLTGALIRMLDKAETPRGVRAITWMLEKASGFTTTQVSEWYARNGYGQISQYIGGNSTYAGRSITRETALDVPAFLAGVKIIAEDMGALPFHLYERSKDRKTIDKAYEHQLYRTLHDIWNPEVSAGAGVEAVTGNALIFGTGYAEIQRYNSGTYLWPWDSEQVRTDKTANGARYFIYRDGSTSKTYSRDQVFCLPGFTLDGVCGENVLRRARNVLGISAAADEYAGRFFAADASPGVTISFPVGVRPMDPTAVTAFKEAWKKWHQSSAKSHEPAVLQDGATASRIGWDNQESQLLEVRRFQVEEVCRILRLPPHKLADLTRSTNNNIEHQGIEYVTNTIGPWIDRWRRSVKLHLLSADEQIAGRIWAEHDVAGLLRGDFATQAEGWRKLLEKGVYSINEVRRWLGLNPVPGGEEHFIQLNLGTVQDVASGATLATNQTGTLPVN